MWICGRVRGCMCELDVYVHTRTCKYATTEAQVCLLVKPLDRQKHKQTETQTDRNTDRQKHRQTETLTDRNTDRNTDRQKHRQKHRLPSINGYSADQWMDSGEGIHISLYTLWGPPPPPLSTTNTTTTILGKAVPTTNTTHCYCNLATVLQVLLLVQETITTTKPSQHLQLKTRQH